jgi:hypothetical protein
MADQQQLPGTGRNRCSANGFEDLRRIGAVEFRHDLDLRRGDAVLHGLPSGVPGLPGADGVRHQHGPGRGRMAGDPVAHLRGILVAAVVEPAILVAAAWRVSLGLGVTQQHQTAHGILESFPVQDSLKG